MKFALGSAQWGMDYGVSNKDGKSPLSEVKKIRPFLRRKFKTWVFSCSKVQNLGLFFVESLKFWSFLFRKLKIWILSFSTVRNFESQLFELTCAQTVGCFPVYTAEESNFKFMVLSLYHTINYYFFFHLI